MSYYLIQAAAVCRLGLTAHQCAAAVSFELKEISDNISER